MQEYNTEYCGQCRSLVPKTGQTTSYTTCDDGDLEKEVAWPEPRFTDNVDGTVKDNLTGLMWTRDTQQISGTKAWSEAITACNDLNYASYTDWRLPIVRELQSLIDFSQYNPELPSGNPFPNVQSGLYWSSTTYVYLTELAWYVYVKHGYVGSNVKSYYYVWPVLGGREGGREGGR